jgi:hypothetical protein
MADNDTFADFIRRIRAGDEREAVELFRPWAVGPRPGPVRPPARAG